MAWQGLGYDYTPQLQWSPFKMAGQVGAGENAALNCVLGSDFGRHNNLHQLDADTVAYVVGNAVRLHSECRAAQSAPRA